MRAIYHISSIRCCGYYFVHLCVATIRGQPLFLWKANTIRYKQVIQISLIDADSSMRSLSVLLSALETSHTTQTALALGW